MKRSTLKYALIMFIGFVALFGIMRVTGLYLNLEFRILNIVVHGAVMYYAIREYNNKERDSKTYNYFNSFIAGFKPAIIAVAAYALFQGIYLSIDTEFMTYVQENGILGQYLTPASSAMVLLMEGTGVSVLLGYLSMRLAHYYQVDVKYGRSL